MIKITIAKNIRQDRARPAGRTRLADASYLAEAYALHVLDRVAERGEIYQDGGSRKSFRFKRKGRLPFFVAEDYAKDATGSAVAEWGSAVAFHRAAGSKAGTFNVTGGMWRGLQVAGKGSVARVQFGKSSIGADSKSKTKTRNIRRKGEVVGTKTTTKAVKLSNRVKARKILENTGINVLAMPDSERDALGSVVAESLAIKFERTLGVDFSHPRTSGRHARLRTRARRRMFRSIGS